MPKFEPQPLNPSANWDPLVINLVQMVGERVDPKITIISIDEKRQ